MLKYIASFFWGSRNETPSLEEAYKSIGHLEDTLSTQLAEEVKELAEDLTTYEIACKIGKITKTEGNTCTVDDFYDFETDRNDLFVGTKISYQLMKVENEFKVVNVHLVENDWNIIETGKRLWHERTLICSVVERKGRRLILNPEDLEVDLDKVCAEFVPVAGDWIELEVKCEVDERVIDLSGKIIEITRLRPLRCQIKLGVVTQWDVGSCTGSIDRNIFFDRDSLVTGFVPVRGDKVICEIIESNQGVCSWRALKIVAEHLAPKQPFNSEKNPSDWVKTHELVTITDNITLNFTKLGEGKLFIIDVKSKEKIKLVCVEFPRLKGQISTNNTIDHIDVEPDNPLALRFECRAKCIGETHELLIFHFENFKMGRWISITVTLARPQITQRDKKDKFFVPRNKRQTIRGVSALAPARFISLRMPDYPVPEKLVDFFMKHRTLIDSNIIKNELEKVKPCLGASLSYMNFEDKFHTLLHLDEIHQMMEMQNYDKERACFVRAGEYLMLEIENLAERRPSVIVGDKVVVRSLTNSDSPDYEGFIHKNSKNHVFVKFSSIFHSSYNGEDYSVYIVASRVTYRRKHYAINLAVRNLGKDWLFPTRISEKTPQLEFVFDRYTDCLNSSTDDSNSPPQNNLSRKNLLLKIQQFKENKDDDLPMRKLEWYNQCLNFYQKEAVRNVLLGVCRPLPYIIFGPPGTGKTVTIVETVLQILRLMPHSRILLSAPSNSAADLLALRLIDTGVLKPGDLIRLVALSAVPNIPTRLAPYCATANIEKEGTESSLPVVTSNGLTLGYNSATVGRHRITVCTCSTAGVLYTMGFSKGHFTHIIVDEAGQTSEPCVHIPLAFLDISSGQAILAGDPMQLGPVVLSRVAAEYGLQESFLERMINRFPYVRDSYGFPKTFGYDPRLITKLIYNYRSLPTLLKLPSLLFYNDDLKPTISDEDSTEARLLSNLEEILPRTQNNHLPSLLFHSVMGENFQNEDSPSWFNPSEAAQVFFYVNELYRMGIKSEDIGIITPYKAQTKLLFDLFKEADFDLPKIGTVEEFQGQEFNVIILSTVRSRRKFVDCDIKFTMGFIANPRRLNVAITRAKCLLILIGNHDLLSSDNSWRSVIEYTTQKGCFIGCDSKG